LGEAMKISWTPERHALATLEGCGGELTLAQNMTRKHARVPDNDDSSFYYWIKVLGSLVPQSDQKLWN